MPAKEKEEVKKKGSSDILGELLTSGKAYHYNFDDPMNTPISTGSMILDSIIKIRAGSTVRLCGEGAELGKTSQCFVLAENYMKVVPNSKTLLVTAESRLSPEMQARSGQKFVDTFEQWVPGTIFILRSNIFDYVADTVEKLMKTMKILGEHLCVIIDSLDGLLLKADSEEESISDNTKVAGVPKLTKLFFRRVGLLNWASDGLILVTSQYSQGISLDKYVKDAVRQGSASGGSAASHQSDYTFMYMRRNKSDYILENDKLAYHPVTNKIIALNATIEIQKSATDVSGAKVKIPIKKGRIGSQIWIEKEVADLIVAYQLIFKKGSWLTFDENVKKQAIDEGIELKDSVQGVNQLCDYLSENKQVFEWFRSKVQEFGL